jgi:hypothetical protein
MIDGFGNSKICQFEYSFLVDEDVVRFDIAVHNFMLVQVLHAQQHLNEKVHYQRLLKELLLLLSTLDVD